MTFLKSKLIKNVVTLFVWQGAIYLVPLITTPYLARVLGVAQFGVLGIAGSVVAYISLISDWGFGLSATRQAARNLSNREALRIIFWDTTYAKLLLGIVSIGIFVLLVVSVPSLRAIWMVLFAYGLQILASVFSANWFLQGLERMGSFAVASLLGRLLSVPLLFLLVHSSKDTSTSAAILGGTFLFSSVASLIASAKYIDILPVRLHLRGAMRQIKDGASLFMSSGVIQLYTQANLVVLGATSSPTQSGFFFGADRIRRAVQGMLTPVTLAVYPRINHLLATDLAKGFRLMWLVLLCQGAVMTLLSVILFGFSEQITILFLGRSYLAAVPSVQILSLLPLVSGLSYVLGVDMLLPMGMSKQYSAITIIASLINISLLVPMCRHFGAVGAAASLVITEVFVTCSMAALIIYYRKRFQFSMRPC